MTKFQNEILKPHKRDFGGHRKLLRKKTMDITRQNRVIKNFSNKLDFNKFKENPDKYCCSVLPTNIHNKCKNTKNFVPFIKKKIFVNCLLEKMINIKIPKQNFENLFTTEEINIIKQFITLERATYDPLIFDKLINKLYKLLSLLGKKQPNYELLQHDIKLEKPLDKSNDPQWLNNMLMLKNENEKLGDI